MSPLTLTYIRCHLLGLGVPLQVHPISALSYVDLFGIKGGESIAGKYIRTSYYLTVVRYFGTTGAMARGGVGRV